MKEITFKSGRKYCIKDQWQEGYMLMYCRNDEDEPYTLLDEYVKTCCHDPQFAHLESYSEKVFKDKMNPEDYENLEECFFRDVEKYGEEYFSKRIAELNFVMFHVDNGLAIPGGPLSW